MKAIQQEQKPKTRDRILITSLELFNLCGEPNVTTIDIANEMGISPGNLYYHFRNKDQIIYELYSDFEQELLSTLSIPEDQEFILADNWLHIQLIFETIWHYRFLYRDLANILGRNPKLYSRFNRLLDRKIRTMKFVCERLIARGIMEATEEEVIVLSKNLALTTTYWLNFRQIRSKSVETIDDAEAGVYQLISLVIPYFNKRYRNLLRKLYSEPSP